MRVHWSCGAPLRLARLVQGAHSGPNPRHKLLQLFGMRAPVFRVMFCEVRLGGTNIHAFQHGNVTRYAGFPHPVHQPFFLSLSLPRSPV